MRLPYHRRARLIVDGMPTPGTELIRAMAAGDHEAFARFYDRYAPLVFPLVLRIDTADEIAYFKNGGILSYVLRKLLSDASAR